MLQLCMGIPYGAPDDPGTFLALVNQLPPGCVFSAFAIGRMQLPYVALAPIAGGNVRVGLEDNIWLERGVKATNGALVGRAVAILESMNVRVLGPAEVRDRLQLAQRADARRAHRRRRHRRRLGRDVSSRTASTWSCTTRTRRPSGECARCSRTPSARGRGSCSPPGRVGASTFASTLEEAVRGRGRDPGERAGGRGAQAAAARRGRDPRARRPRSCARRPPACCRRGSRPTSCTPTASSSGTRSTPSTSCRWSRSSPASERRRTRWLARCRSTRRSE